jgi:hypothetical protein
MRVTNPSPGGRERSFHVFYQMLLGATPALRDAAQLRATDGVETFRYLRDNRRVLARGVDDAERWGETLEALAWVGLDEDAVSAVCQCLTAILCLGNVDFVDGEPSDSGAAGGATGFGSASIAGLASRRGVADEAAASSSDDEAPETHPFFRAASALGVPEGSLAAHFTHRSIKTGSTGTAAGSTRASFIQKALTPVQAEAMRDCLARTAYGALFGWMVRCINRATSHRAWRRGMQPAAGSAMPSLGAGATSAAERSRGVGVGLVDIFGFEDVSPDGVNGLNQLLINFANEQLQAVCEEVLFSDAMAEAKRQKVDPGMLGAGSDAAAALRSPVLDVFLKKGGLFAVLEDKTRLAGERADAEFVGIVTKEASAPPPMPAGRATTRAARAPGGRSHPVRIVSPMEGGDTALRGLDFVVTHFAGQVRYCAAEFTVVNSNTGAALGDAETAALSLLASSTNPVLQEAAELVASKTAIAAPTERRGAGSARAKPSAVAASSCVSARFRQALRDVVHVLQTSGTHFVRCIKTNSRRKEFQLEGALVLQQLGSSGIVRAIAARAAAFTALVPFAGLPALLQPLLSPQQAASLRSKQIAGLLNSKLARSAMQSASRNRFLEASAAELRGRGGRLLSDLTGDDASSRSHVLPEGKAFVVGESALLFRPPALVTLQLAAQRALEHGACRLQAVFRGYRQRASFRSLRGAVYTATRAAKRFLFRAKFRSMQAVRHLHVAQAAAAASLTRQVDANAAASESLLIGLQEAAETLGDLLQGAIVPTTGIPMLWDRALQWAEAAVDTGAVLQLLAEPQTHGAGGSGEDESAPAGEEKGGSISTPWSRDPAADDQDDTRAPVSAVDLRKALQKLAKARSAQQQVAAARRLGEQERTGDHEQAGADASLAAEDPTGLIGLAAPGWRVSSSDQLAFAAGAGGASRMAGPPPPPSRALPTPPATPRPPTAPLDLPARHGAIDESQAAASTTAAAAAAAFMAGVEAARVLGRLLDEAEACMPVGSICLHDWERCLVPLRWQPHVVAIRTAHARTAAAVLLAHATAEHSAAMDERDEQRAVVLTPAQQPTHPTSKEEAEARRRQMSVIVVELSAARRRSALRVTRVKQAFDAAVLRLEELREAVAGLLGFLHGDAEEARTEERRGMTRAVNEQEAHDRARQAAEQARLAAEGEAMLAARRAMEDEDALAAAVAASSILAAGAQRRREQAAARQLRRLEVLAMREEDELSLALREQHHEEQLAKQRRAEEAETSRAAHAHEARMRRVYRRVAFSLSLWAVRHLREEGERRRMRLEDEDSAAAEAELRAAEAQEAAKLKSVFATQLESALSALSALSLRADASAEEAARADAERDEETARLWGATERSVVQAKSQAVAAVYYSLDKHAGSGSPSRASRLRRSHREQRSLASGTSGAGAGAGESKRSGEKHWGGEVSEADAAWAASALAIHGSLGEVAGLAPPPPPGSGAAGMGSEAWEQELRRSGRETRAMEMEDMRSRVSSRADRQSALNQLRADVSRRESAQPGASPVRPAVTMRDLESPASGAGAQAGVPVEDSGSSRWDGYVSAIGTPNSPIQAAALAAERAVQLLCRSTEARSRGQPDPMQRIWQQAVSPQHDGATGSEPAVRHDHHSPERAPQPLSGGGSAAGGGCAGAGGGDVTPPHVREPPTAEPHPRASLPVETPASPLPVVSEQAEEEDEQEETVTGAVEATSDELEEPATETATGAVEATSDELALLHEIEELTSAAAERSKQAARGAAAAVARAMAEPTPALPPTPAAAQGPVGGSAPETRAASPLGDHEAGDHHDGEDHEALLPHSAPGSPRHSHSDSEPVDRHAHTSSYRTRRKRETGRHRGPNLSLGKLAQARAETKSKRAADAHASSAAEQRGRRLPWETSGSAHAAVAVAASRSTSPASSGTSGAAAPRSRIPVPARQRASASSTGNPHRATTGVASTRGPRALQSLSPAPMPRSRAQTGALRPSTRSSAAAAAIAAKRHPAVLPRRDQRRVIQGMSQRPRLPASLAAELLPTDIDNAAPAVGLTPGGRHPTHAGAQRAMQARMQQSHEKAPVSPYRAAIARETDPRRADAASPAARSPYALAAAAASAGPSPRLASSMASEDAPPPPQISPPTSGGSAIVQPQSGRRPSRSISPSIVRADESWIVSPTSGASEAAVRLMPDLGTTVGAPSTPMPARNAAITVQSGNVTTPKAETPAEKALREELEEAAAILGTAIPESMRQRWLSPTAAASVASRRSEPPDSPAMHRAAGLVLFGPLEGSTVVLAGRKRFA